MEKFWEAIEAQLKALETATTAAEVIAICPPSSGTSVGDGWFGGGGGDDLPDQSLYKAGWRYDWTLAPYHWQMEAPNGDTITYVEGDLYARSAG